MFAVRRKPEGWSGAAEHLVTFINSEDDSSPWLKVFQLVQYIRVGSVICDCDDTQWRLRGLMIRNDSCCSEKTLKL